MWKGSHLAPKCGRWFCRSEVVPSWFWITWGTKLRNKAWRKQTRLKLHQTLQQQGLAEAETAILFGTYTMQVATGLAHICANSLATCMVLLNLWSRAFLGRGNTLNNPISGFKSKTICEFLWRHARHVDLVALCRGCGCFATRAWHWYSRDCHGCSHPEDHWKDGKLREGFSCSSLHCHEEGCYITIKG